MRMRSLFCANISSRGKRMKIRFLNTKESSGNLRVVVSLLAVLALVLGGAFAARAQNTTASIRGTVTDEQGAVVAGADVIVTNADTGYSRSDKADKDGSYSFQSLPIGRYTLNVSGKGFKAYQEKDIVLHVNDSRTFDAQLKVGATTETIEVVANTSQVELNNAELSGTVAGDQITQLPLNGRSFAQLVTMVPGVAVDNGFSYDKKGVNGGADLSVGGGPSNANLWLVGGASNVRAGSNCRLGGGVATARSPLLCNPRGVLPAPAGKPPYGPATTTGCFLKGGLADPDPTNAGGAFTASPSTPGTIDVIPAARLSPAGKAI